MFTVMVSGDSPSHQWQKDGADISDIADTYSGTNTASLTVLSAADGVDEGMYRVVVSNAASSPGVMSNAATLTVGMLESIWCTLSFILPRVEFYLRRAINFMKFCIFIIHY